jgi:sugar phosphate isomerase/epimerase
MRIAVHERLLGDTEPLSGRLRRAKDAGFAGVEFEAAALAPQIDALIELLPQHGLEASALIYGDASAIIHPDPRTRHDGLEGVRLALTDAGDLGASGVVLTLPGACLLPDLSPYKAPSELAFDLLIEHLRWLEDYANAMHTALYLQPDATSGVMRTLAGAVEAARRRSFHPCVRACADLGADSAPETLRAHAAQVACARLPAAMADHAAALPDFDGWLSVYGSAPALDLRALALALQR